jgi:hypothetical protein
MFCFTPQKKQGAPKKHTHKEGESVGYFYVARRFLRGAGKNTTNNFLQKLRVETFLPKSRQTKPNPILYFVLALFYFTFSGVSRRKEPESTI